MADTATSDLLKLTAQIATAYVSGNSVDVTSVSQLLLQVHRGLVGVTMPTPAQVRQEPAVPIRRSIQRDHLVCLEDGAKVKALKRYLKRFDLTPETYRAKWGLPADYPMVAPNFGRTLRQAISAEPPVTTPKPDELPGPAPDEPPEQHDIAAAQHTAASVFANFPTTEPPSDGAAAASLPEKPTRKRFAQQLMRHDGRESR